MRRFVVRKAQLIRTPELSPASPDTQTRTITIDLALSPGAC